MRAAWLAGLALAATGCFSLAGPPAQAGIHARLSYSDTAGLRLVEVPDGPAKDAGLRVGDRVVSIDDEPVNDLSREEVVARLRGPVGSRVVLEIQRDGVRRYVAVPRASYARSP